MRINFSYKKITSVEKTQDNETRVGFVNNWYYVKIKDSYNIYNSKTDRENTNITILDKELRVMEWIKTKPPKKLYDKIIEEIKEDYGHDFKITKLNWLED